MSTPTELERIVTAWLRSEATTVGTDRILAGALARVATVGQDRSWQRWLVRPRLRHARLAASVMAMTLLAATIAWLRPGVDSGPTPGTAATSPSSGPDVVDGPSTSMIEVPLTGTRLWFTPPAAAGWEVGLKDDLYISRNIIGPQGAEAILLFTSFPTAGDVRSCLLDPASTSLEDLADAVATAPGTALGSGPTTMVVGGRPAAHVALTVVPLWDDVGMPREPDMGCDPGYFFAWDPYPGGAMWVETVPGDIIDVWTVDVDGRLVVLQSILSKRVVGRSAERVRGQLEAVVASIRFDKP